MASYWDALPEHLQDHIKSFIPCTFMPVDVQNEIKVKSALYRVKQFDDYWNSLCNSHDTSVHDRRFTFLRHKLREECDECLNENLSLCRCCLRHSGRGQYRDCSCKCRHWKRLLNFYEY